MRKQKPKHDVTSGFIGPGYKECNIPPPSVNLSAIVVNFLTENKFNPPTPKCPCTWIFRGVNALFNGLNVLLFTCVSAINISKFYEVEITIRIRWVLQIPNHPSLCAICIKRSITLSWNACSIKPPFVMYVIKTFTFIIHV